MVLPNKFSLVVSPSQEHGVGKEISLLLSQGLDMNHHIFCWILNKPLLYPIPRYENVGFDNEKEVVVATLLEPPRFPSRNAAVGNVWCMRVCMDVCGYVSTGCEWCLSVRVKA